MSARDLRLDGVQKRTRPTGLVYASFVIAGLSAVFAPIILGPIAIALAAIASSRKDPQAGRALIFAIVAMLVGFLLQSAFLVT